jgi:hypothetical protein
MSKPKSSLWKDPGSRWGALRVETDALPLLVLIKYAGEGAHPLDLGGAIFVSWWQRPANQGTALAADVANRMGDSDRAEVVARVDPTTMTYAEVSAPGHVLDYGAIAAAMVRDLGFDDQP